MRTLWRRGGSDLDALSLQRDGAIRALLLDRVRDHAALGTGQDDSVWGVLFCSFCRRDDCGRVADVARKTLMYYKTVATIL